VDAQSITMFQANRLTSSVKKVWCLEVDPAGSKKSAEPYRDGMHQPGAGSFFTLLSLAVTSCGT
jgi:hypothetical protein